MTITNRTRQILDRKQWEMCNNLPFTSAAGVSIASSSGIDKYKFCMTSATQGYLYSPQDDAWITLVATTAIAGTFGTASTTTYHPHGPSGTATGGNIYQVNTNLTIPYNLDGYTIRITSGPAAGEEKTISGNTFGANSVITVSSAFSVSPTSSSTYLILSGRFYAFQGGTGGPGMRYFDIATNTWSGALSATGAPAAGTDAKLTATAGAPFKQYTATSATSTTLTVSSAFWATNTWTNYQVRIISGTGAGQVRNVASNTGTVITVSSAFTTTPDATSVFVTQGNEDYLYLAGNNAVTLYRYSISGNTWTTLSPSVARTGAPGTGMTLDWVDDATDFDWNYADGASGYLNGRRIYSIRGGGSGQIDYYDIPTNAWTALGAPPFSAETFTTGTSSTKASNGIIYIQKDATGRFFAYDPVYNRILGWSLNTFPQGTAILGDRVFSVDLTEGLTTIRWVYFNPNTSNLLFRQMVI